MDRYVAFLRGINLGGRRITKEELRSCFEQMGCEGIATFRASGNVVFQAPDREHPIDLSARLEGGLAESLGYEVPVFLRSGAEVQAIAGHDPFEPRLVEASAGKLQVSLLKVQPGAEAGAAVLGLSGEEDRLAIRGRELYWLPSGGISESALDLKAIETALGLMTMRTKGTIEQIASRHFL